MTTRTKLSLSMNSGSVMLMLSLFAKPLRIPELAGDALLLGGLVLIILSFRYIKKLKQERAKGIAPANAANPNAPDPRRLAKQKLFKMLGIVVIFELCAPLWLPLTGTSFGTRGNLLIGIASAVFCSAIIVVVWKKTDEAARANHARGTNAERIKIIGQRGGIDFLARLEKQNSAGQVAPALSF